MVKKSELTQQKIIETAREMFIEKGFDGVKMQELADRAGVNKGLLHHYFNNKQSLFNDVFAHAADQLFGRLMESFSNQGSFNEKVNSIVDAYLDMLLANPRLPVFIFFEINRDSELIQEVLSADRIGTFLKGLKESNPKITDQNAIHVILTIVSLSVFPFIAKPVVMKMIKNEKEFSKLIEERRPIIKLLVSNLVNSL
ncbi:MAG: TetR/AcrR family transcriptional regulator [Bacteroidota bacterium]